MKRYFVVAVLMFLAATAAFAHSNIIDVTAYGATPGDIYDDGAAIQTAAAALGNGGQLYFPPGIYKIFTSTALSGYSTPYLVNFANKTGISLICNGCTLAIENRAFTSAEGTIFSFDDCTNVLIDGFNVTGPTGSNQNLTGSVVGVEFVRLNPGNVNVRMPRNKVQGVIGALLVSNYSGNPSDPISSEPISRNIEVGVLDVKESFYGITCAWSGDNMTVHQLVTDTIVRSYYVYGVQNHNITVSSKNAWATDCLITSENGKGVSDLRLKYVNVPDSTNSHRVELLWV